MRRIALWLIASCGANAGVQHTTPHVAPAASTAAPAEFPSEPERMQLFDHVVAQVHRFHVFSAHTEKNLGFRWEDHLAEMRAEFAAAKTRDALVLAVFHFANSLHDVHCQFRPPKRGERLGLGFSLDVDWHGTSPEFYVERVSERAKGHVFVGDIAVSADGVLATQWLQAHERESNQNSWANIATDIAHRATSRRVGTTTTKPHDTSQWVFRSPNGTEHTETFTWERKASGNADGDFALDFGTRDCVNADPKTYGSYEMVARGYRTCIYASKESKYKDYPIVRQVSFRYDEVPHGPLADHELITKTLSKLGGKGVLLDVQDNGGGINPNVFLDWWAHKPYIDTDTYVLLDDAFGDEDAIDGHGLNMSHDLVTTYLTALKNRKPNQRFAPARPFECKPGDCGWDNRYVPSHPVTKLPVAVLVGPDCASSCDAFVWHFDHDDLGPLVGRLPMSGFTTHRAHFDVVLREHEPSIGTIDFAVSYDTAHGEQDSIEGSTLTLDAPVPRTFANRAHYDAALVDAAISQLVR